MNADSETEAGATPPLRQRLKEATSEAILAAAEQAFGLDGLHGARMEDVASRAGVSVGTLYNYFTDRAGLLDALLESRRGALIEALDLALGQTETEPFEKQIESVLRAVLEHFEAHRPFLSIVMQEEHAKDASLFPASRRPRETLRAIHARLKELVTRGVSRGKLRRESADLYPGLLLGMVRSVLIRTLYEPEPSGPVTARVSELVRFFLEGAAERA